MAFSPDGSTIAVVVRGKKSEEPQQIKVFARDGRVLITSYLAVWDVVEGKVLYPPKDTGPRTLATELGWSPDGKHLAAARGRSIGESSLILYDASTGSAELELKPTDGSNINTNSRPAFRPDGRRIACVVGSGPGGSQDQTVRLWETARGREVLTLAPAAPGTPRLLSNFQNNGTSLVFTPDGSRLREFTKRGGPRFGRGPIRPNLQQPTPPTIIVRTWDAPPLPEPKK